MQAHEDVPYRVSHMKDDIYDAWTRTPGKEPSSNSDQTGFMHADRLLNLYDILKKKPLVSQPDLIQLGHQVGVRDQAFRRAYEESQRRRKGYFLMFGQYFSSFIWFFKAFIYHFLTFGVTFLYLKLFFS